MFFTNTPHSTHVVHKRLNRMVYFPSLIPGAPIPPTAEPAASIQTPRPPDAIKKVYWGEPTWYLFHTMAHKIKDDLFNEKRLEILNVIYTISCNLPCPDCANHAREYLDRINYTAVYSKQHLKDVLFHFHNEVNQRRGVELFLYMNLDEKYNTAVMRNIVVNFMTHFDRKGKLLPDSMQRDRIIVFLKKWFNANIQIFAP
jgi:hypothetical protein